MKIYTKTGDKGQTSLANGHRVSKSSARIHAYGTSDELNSYIGLLRAGVARQALPNEILKQVDEQLYYIQNRLFDLGARLAASDLPIKPEFVTLLEQWIDQMQARLTPLRVFILPAGSEVVAQAHVCRTICRRLERLMVDLPENEVAQDDLISINRLSDYLFTLARYLGESLNIPVSAWEK